MNDYGDLVNARETRFAHHRRSLVQFRFRAKLSWPPTWCVSLCLVFVFCSAGWAQVGGVYIDARGLLR
ncbi:MAG: hypothetical protein ABGZ17_19425, partial [Planctomycetaceae bacterium]